MHVALTALLAAPWATVLAASPTSLELRAPKLDHDHGTLFERAERAIELTRREYGFSSGSLSRRADSHAME